MCFIPMPILLCLFAQHLDMVPQETKNLHRPVPTDCAQRLRGKDPVWQWNGRASLPTPTKRNTPPTATTPSATAASP